MAKRLQPYWAALESPSMGMVCPEIDFALSEARKTDSAAMSLGSTKRLPIGCSGLRR
jgi:hypothetical protein